MRENTVFPTAGIRSLDRFCVFSTGPLLHPQEGLSPMPRILTKNFTKNLIEVLVTSKIILVRETVRMSAPLQSQHTADGANSLAVVLLDGVGIDDHCGAGGGGESTIGIVAAHGGVAGNVTTLVEQIRLHDLPLGQKDNRTVVDYQVALRLAALGIAPDAP